MSNSAATAPSHPAPSINLNHLDQLGQASTAWIAENIVQIALACAVGAGIVVLLSAIRTLGIRLCRHDRLGTGWPTVIGRVVSRTKFWFMVIFAAELVAGYTDPPPLVAHTIQTLFTIAAALQVALWARELVLGFIDHRAGADPDNRNFGSAMGLIRLLITFAFFAIAFVLILDNLGVNVTGLVAGLGIGGIAIGLAAQGIFSDLFAALSIIFDKPFRLGDTVRWDDNTGVVEQIGLKTTRIRANTGEQLIVSNSELLKKELHNETHFEHRRFTMTLGVIYQTPIAQLEAIPQMVADIVKSHQECTLIRCMLANFNSSSLDFELLFDVRADPSADAFRIRSEVYMAILKAFNDAKIDFAYPTQTAFTAAPDGRMIYPYPAEDDATAKA